MAKRPHADAEAGTDLTVLNTHNDVRSKKVKLKESAGTNLDDTASKPPKEERKEPKRLKKLSKKTEPKDRSINGVSKDKTIKKVGRSAEKATRNADKARIKSIKESTSQEEYTRIIDGQDAVGREKERKQADDGIDANGRVAAKAARKTEKKSLKSIKELGHQNGIEVSSLDETSPKSGQRELQELRTTHKEEVADETSTKALRKAEKKRLRQLKVSKDNKQNGNPIAANKDRLDVPEQTMPTTNAKSKSKSKSKYTEDHSLAALPRSEIDSFLSKHFITITDPSTLATLRPITSFSHLPKMTDTSAFVTFKSPTPIQSAAWPFLLSGRDVIGVAETGSGKTLAFGIPCIRALKNLPQSKKSHGTVARAVMVSPTRELAVQIHDQLAALAKPAGLTSVCVYGGVPKAPQIAALRSAHIIVATPGRLNDLISEGSADLSGANYLVLDEADRMLDKGFEDDIRKIISCCPSTAMGRQTAMFTATWPPSVRDLAAIFMEDPVHISIGDNHGGELRANTRIEQRVEVVDPRGKEQRLLQIIKQHQSGKNKDDRILVFCLYKKEATRVEGFLKYQGLRVTAIHGDMSQENRSRSLESFKSGACPLLVATDVAARGLDIPSVKLVLNCTFPLTVEDYVHRIGRWVLSTSFPPSTFEKVC